MAPPSGASSTYGRSRPMVAAPTQPAEWVALYTYPSSAALYSQLPISDAALAPISARAPGIPRTSRYARVVVSPIAGRCWGLGAGCRHHRDRTRGSAGGTSTAPSSSCSRARARRHPQNRQNDLPGMTGSPHGGHRPKGAPQSTQNRSSSPRDAPHRGHVTTRHLYPLASPQVHGRQPHAEGLRLACAGWQASTMEIRYLQPDGLVRSPAFSHGAVIPPGATTIYIGGQNGVDETGQVVAGHDAAAQAVRAVDNVETVLRAAGATLADVVAWTVLIAADADVAAAYGAIAPRLARAGAPPLVTGARVAGLAVPGALLEISAIAAVAAGLLRARCPFAHDDGERARLHEHRAGAWRRLVPLRCAGLASGHGSVGRDDYQAHGLVPGSFRGHPQHDPPAPGVDVVGAGRDRGVDGAYPVLERAVEAGVAVEVDGGCAGGLGVRPADADEDAGPLVRPEPGACRIRRLADWGRRVRRAVRWGTVVVECHDLVAGGPHRCRRGRRRFRHGHSRAARSGVRVVPPRQGEA